VPAVLVALVQPTLAQSPPTTNQGPTVPEWGPGRAPPAPEGAPSQGTTQQPGPTDDGGTYYYAPGAQVPPGRIAPPVGRIGGVCYFDLRGPWYVSGLQTTPYYNSYETRVYVRQFGNYLQGEQPSDNVSYYGVCRGDRIQLDVYEYGRLIGYQTAVAQSPYNWTAAWTSFRSGLSRGEETWSR
jgi:hypothetical protein